MSGVEEVAVILIAVVAITESAKIIVNNVNEVLAGLKQSENLLLELFHISSGADKKVIDAINAAKEEILAAIDQLGDVIAAKLKEAKIKDYMDELALNMDDWSTTQLDLIMAGGMSDPELSAMFSLIQDYREAAQRLIKVLNEPDVPRSPYAIAQISAANAFRFQLATADWGLRVKARKAPLVIGSVARLEALTSITNYQGGYEMKRFNKLRLQVNMTPAVTRTVDEFGFPINLPGPNDPPIDDPPEVFYEVVTPAILHSFTISDPDGPTLKDSIFPSIAGIVISPDAYYAIAPVPNTFVGETIEAGDEFGSITFQQPTHRGLIDTYARSSKNFKALSNLVVVLSDAVDGS